ncbi:MAG: hypothetical protein GWN71_30325, partial [Gammaproteobacteria bacterium]|nr:hypothetical protein [Gemmatimonadota bacterium]NIU77694.1 hypothetical protein [Gammaproteobacteria bacterium]
THFDEAIDPCGDACDVCRGVTVEDMAAEAMLAHGRGRGRGRRRGRGPSGFAADGPASRRKQGSPAGDTTPWDEVPYELDPEADPLFERLRALRKRLADERGVPAYVVFNDRTLREMCARRPSTAGELARINGVGPKKLERYGTD